MHLQSVPDVVVLERVEIRHEISFKNQAWFSEVKNF